MLRLDGTHQIGDAFFCIVGILAALQDKGAETQIPAFPTAFKDFLLCQAVALGAGIAAADAAVITVVFAVIGKFDQSADINSPAIDPFTNRNSLLGQIAFDFGVIEGDQGQQVLIGQIFCLCQTVDQMLHGAVLSLCYRFLSLFSV